MGINIKTAVVRVMMALFAITSSSEAMSDTQMIQPTPEQRLAMTEVFKKVKDKLVIIEGDDSCGSGFVLTMEDGKRFLLTNKHVVQMQKNVTATLLNGKKLQLGAFEVASNRDLARFSLPSEIPSLKADSNEPNIGDDVYVFGNSEGSGVVTDLRGEVLGVGPEDIEVSAAFVGGNSGSAVFNKDGNVIGVATFATYDPDPNNWVKKDSRFSNVRRFAVRLTGVKWDKIKFLDFYNKCLAEEKKRQEAGGVVPQVKARFSNTKLYIDPYSRILTQFSLNLSGGPKIIKKPIVRVCVLIKGSRGYHMGDCVMLRPGPCGGVTSPPVYAYGNKGDGIYYTDSKIGVYFIEGLSYWSGILPDNIKRANIRYFVPGYGCPLFGLGYHMAKPPEIVCFRFECWQNGALAGVYDSKSPASLRAKNVPVDWYVWGKYPNQFDYLGRGIYPLNRTFDRAGGNIVP